MVKTNNKIKKEIFRQLYLYKDQAIEVKNRVNIDTHIGAKTTASTAEKLSILLIKVFKLVWAKNCKKIIMDMMGRFFKMVSLHLKQLKKLKQTNVKIIKDYFTDAARIVYCEMGKY